ncbi:MAG TPA: arylamine N-acetyltransferase [Polyangiaceae bacterium]|nr:arylamine N-acetyltransferase [Polyangiaceae bacterium]
MTSKAIVDLEAYFERIRYAGPRDASLDALHGITEAHVRQIPFENLDVLLNRPISLQPASIARKLIDERRGGYCFEHNTLLLHVLEALGFQVTPLSARVRIQRPRTDLPARTHMFLRVELGADSWLTDVGIGGFSLTRALRLELDTPQPTPHDIRRIVSEGAWTGLTQRAPDARLFHQAYFGGAWHDLCDFTLEPMPEIDRVIASWYTSAHPESHFKNRLMVARATADGRLTLANREFGQRGPDGRSESRLLDSPEELLSVLDEHFGLRFPAGTRFQCSALDWPR